MRYVTSFRRNTPEYAAAYRNMPHTLTYVYKTQDNAKHARFCAALQHNATRLSAAGVSKPLVSVRGQTDGER